MGRRNEQVTKERFERLPVWAQDHIVQLKREREAALHQLNKHEQQQEESPFFAESLVCDGERGRGPSARKTYYKTDGVLYAQHAGITLRISVVYEDRIELSWSEGTMHTLGEVAFIPSSHQQARLVHRDNMCARTTVSGERVS